LDGPSAKPTLFLLAFPDGATRGENQFAWFLLRACWIGAVHWPQSAEVSGTIENTWSFLSHPLQFCSGSWDGAIKIWVLPEEAGGAPVAQKKRKSAQPAAAKVARHSPKLEFGWLILLLVVRQSIEAQITLQGHTQCVTGVLWPTANQVISASWDQTLRLWDVESGACSATFAGSKPIQVREHIRVIVGHLVMLTSLVS
jgi:WD40 repeat protein